ncbi:MAG: PAS domain S-box protein [Alphaproteobacteria bacterium]|nr:PAS domain S-box protein [Alphaproteobacteria bacterium]MDP6566993.1 PAS domain S-box protein [Alphaproteobacteria bacterium]MDP6812172.1 PAS domain S-box protein [Alphaproteobacteria bacterium]
MATFALILGALAIGVLYDTAFEEARARLMETAQSQARLMEAVARFDRRESRDYPGGAAAATISQIVDAHERYQGFGETGEFTVARRDDDKMVFILRHRHADLDRPKPVPFASPLAEPMRRALSGKSGSVVGPDYRGVTVLAAHEPVALLDLGIVAKIDLAEIRAPFVKAGLIVAALAALIVTFGAAFFITASNAMIRRIREGEDRYRTLSDLTSEGVAIHDDGIIMEANQAFADMYGYEISDLIGMHVLDLAVPEEQESVVDHMSRNQPDTYESTSFRKDGSRIDIEIKGMPTVYKGKRMRVTRLRDLTERRLAEAAMRRSEEQYRDLIERAVVGIMIHDPDWNILFANQAVADIFGYASANEVMALGTVPPLLAAPEVARLKFIRDGRFQDEEQPVRLEYEGLRKDGASIWLSSHNRRMRWHGQPASQAIIADITDRRRAEQALAASEETLRQRERQLRLITDAVPASITYLDASLHYRFVNRVAEQWYARPAAEIVGKHAREVLGDNAFDQLLDQPDFPSASRSDNLEVSLTYPDGVDRQVEITTVPHLGDDGELQGYFVLTIDVTERQALEARLRQSQKMEAVGQLTGGIAHDFNNLLSVIIGNIAMLEDKLGPDHSLRELTAPTMRAADHAATLTHRMLAFARQQPLELRRLDVNDVLGNAEDLLRSSLTEDIEFTTALAEDLYDCVADPVQLEQAILNLAINARDAMPKGGRLHIETANVQLSGNGGESGPDLPPGPYLMITVNDDGDGIAPDIQPRIFDPFFTTKDVGAGSGLGLSMVFGFVRQSHGDITVESDIGAGTTFRIYLPCAEDGEEREDRPIVATPDRTGTGETILLVEDDPDVREMVATVLGRRGYLVLEASDGRAGLERLSDHRKIDLLLTDVMLPGGIGGRELANRARTRDPGLKVLFMSGYDREVIVEQGRMNPDGRLLAKPFTPSDLGHRVRAVLDEE